MKSKKSILIAAAIPGLMTVDEYQKMSVEDFDSQFIAKKEPEESETVPLIPGMLNKKVYKDLFIDVWNGMENRGIPAKNSILDSAVYTFEDRSPCGEVLFIQDYSGRDIIEKDLIEFYKKYGWKTEKRSSKNFSSVRNEVILDLSSLEGDEIIRSKIKELRNEPPDTFYV